MKSSHQVMLLLITAAMLVLVSAKTEKKGEPNPLKKYWAGRSWACSFGKHPVPYDRCMEILNRFKDMTTLSQVKSHLNKYPNCDALNDKLPKSTEKLLIQCLKAIDSADSKLKLN